MAAVQIVSRFYTRALLQIGLPLLIATSTGLADNSVLNPQPNFAGAPGGGVTANAGNCFLGNAAAGGGAIGGASPLDLSSLGVSSKSGSANLGGDACKVTAIPSSSSLTCDSAELQDAQGNFDPTALNRQLGMLSAYDGKPPLPSGAQANKAPKEGSLNCEKNEFNQIKNEMACVQNQGQLLAQQIGSLSQIYQQNITRFQNDDQAYKQREGDRQSQMDAIQKLLGGNKNSGTKGLLQEQSDLQKLVNDTMPQDIAAALAQSVTVANQRAIIVANIQKHTMSLTGDCFKTTPKAGYKCTPGGPDLSPENYIVCMYGKYAHVSNGQYVQGALADSNATAAQNTLQGILDQMTNQTALSYQTPTDPTSASAAALKPSYGNTIQDLINNFVSKTAGMTVNGISVSTTITNELQSCYLAAQSEVQSERTDPSSAISIAQTQQTASETALKAGFDQKLEAYSQKWTEAMGVLSAQNLPLSLAQCKSQDITYEGNCLTDVQNQLTGLLKGDASQAPFTMNVPAQFPDTQIPLTSLQCRGINGCVTQLQAVNDQVTQAKTTLTTGRQAYETQARQSTDQFTSQVAALLGNQSAQLRKQLASINSSLQGMGVTGNIGFPNVQGQPMQYETNADGTQGLPKMPDNIMGLIGGKVNPPLMDLTDNSNNDGSAIAEGVKKADDGLQKVETVREDWEALATKCSKADLADEATQNVQAISNCMNVICDFSQGGTHANVNLMVQQIIEATQANMQLSNDDSSSSGNANNDDDDDDDSSGGNRGAGRVRLNQKDQSKMISDETAALNSLGSGANCSDPSSSNGQSVGTTSIKCNELSGEGDHGSQGWAFAQREKMLNANASKAAGTTQSGSATGCPAGGTPGVTPGC